MPDDSGHTGLQIPDPTTAKRLTKQATRRASLTAIVYPNDPGRLLLSIEDDAGAPVDGLPTASFHVLALGLDSLSGGPYADDKISVPVTGISPITDPLLPQMEMPGFYELTLGEVPIPGGTGQVEQRPAANLWPCTFLVQIRSGNGYQGQAIITP